MQQLLSLNRYFHRLSYPSESPVVNRYPAIIDIIPTINRSNIVPIRHSSGRNSGRRGELPASRTTLGAERSGKNFASDIDLQEIFADDQRPVILRSCGRYQILRLGAAE